MTDLDRLDSYLSSDKSPEDSMLLSDLDGFLHGIACSPVLIPAEEWMSVALGVPPEEVPMWVLEAILGLPEEAVDELIRGCEQLSWLR